MQSSIPGIPAEILSQEYNDNCLHRLRGYFNDCEAGKESVCDVKLIMLGNGRVGKTQICRRLREEEFDDATPSTHGIQITSAPLPQSDEEDPVRLQIWDFGGQDIYHGTHTLFLQSRAVFVIVWALAMENEQYHDYGGYRFRNEPLPYWVSYVRQAAGEEWPILIVQTQCDSPNDKVKCSPLKDEMLSGFSFTPQILNYSALTNRKKASFIDSLYEAAMWFREKSGKQYIGAGWMKVKRKLESMRDFDQKLKKEERKYRTLTRDQFWEICAAVEGMSEHESLLTYLHNSGIVFYRPDLFHNRIILDQAGALEAIYVVFERDKCHLQLLQRKGRFTLSDLGDLIWNEQHYDVEDQKLFLSMMQSCGICFEHRPSDKEYAIEPVYIAPDLLPEKLDEVVLEWNEEDEIEEVVFTYEFLFPCLMREIIAKVGAQAGLAAEYWRNGVYAYEMETKSRALIDQVRHETGWGGSIRIRTQHGQAKRLLMILAGLIEEQEQRFHVCSQKNKKTQVALAKYVRSESKTNPRFGSEPKLSNKTKYFVSYAMNDETDPKRENIVDRFCVEAEGRGITITRDRTHLGLGESIPKFMQRVGEGDRVFVILCEKYLKSEFCMYELHEIWRNHRLVGEEFLTHVRVYILPNTDIWSSDARLKWVKYWEDKHEALKQDAHRMGPRDHEGLRNMRLYCFHIGEILETVASTLLPRSFEELKKYWFEDTNDNE